MAGVNIVVGRRRYFPELSGSRLQLRRFVYAEYADIPGVSVHICDTPPVPASEFEPLAQQLRPAFDLVPADVLAETTDAWFCGGVALYLYDATGRQLGQVHLNRLADSLPAMIEGAVFWPGTRHANLRGEMVDA